MASPAIRAGRAAATPARLDIRGLSKRYGNTQALAGVDLEVRPGEILALLGANGAGKSTLIEIVAGSRRADAGEIRMDGEPVEITSPAASRRIGIGVIHQALSVIPSLTIAENFLVKRDGPTGVRAIAPPRSAAAVDAEAALASMGAPMRAATLCERLGFGERQLVEIAIAISSQVRLLFMDEPTSGLSDVEQARLFDVVRSLAADGVSIVYVSHRMDEVFELADRMVVLREGRPSGVFERSETDRAAIIAAMLGGELGKELEEDRARSKPARTEAPVFRIRHFHTRGVQELALDVEAGEVVGLYGIVEAGCSALLEGLFGARPWTGVMELDGQRISPRSPTDARALGFALVPSDHRRRGLVPGWPIAENLLLGRGTWRRDFLRRISGDLKRRLTDILGMLRMNAWGLEQSVDELSGGTQQKVVVGRWLVDQPRLLMLDDPTRGIDVGAKADIYELLRGLREQGVATLLHSSELTELVSVADRVLVMRDGAIRGEVGGRDLDRQKILFLATHA